MKHLTDRIFMVESEEAFSSLALDIFHYQSTENKVYAQYIKHLNIDFDLVKEVEQIPFLPIDFFKTHQIVCGDKNPELIFESSGTTGQQSSRHLVLSKEIYQSSFTRSFELFIGSPEKKCILALLPSYLERENSSLVYMMNHLIQLSQHPDSGFYLNDLEGLAKTLIKRNKDRYPTLLIGVSFALLDLAERFPMVLQETIRVMETGGMKGRRKELVRAELHRVLKEAFQQTLIYSEYGMTELLSQAYSGKNNRFTPPPWMKVLIRDPYDPLTLLQEEKTGAVNIIDLANLNSCSFIATDDSGNVFKDGTFEITGRLDSSEIRGCNLMVG